MFMEAKKRQRGLQSPQHERFKPKSQLLQQKPINSSAEHSASTKDSLSVHKKQYQSLKETERIYLPPVWIDIQEEIDEKISLLHTLFVELKPLRQ